MSGNNNQKKEMESSRQSEAPARGKLGRKSNPAQQRLRIRKELGARIHKVARITDMPTKQIVAKAIRTGFSIISNL